MSFFEFLIQREGDRSWLPIESSEVEILEGRYRIMGRSPQPNLSIDIRISYLDLDSVPPRRRTHKRTSQTNEQGLIAVMPFTALRNGKWGIQCSSPASQEQASESPSSNSWQQQIQLQVLEDTAHHVEDFEPEYAAVEPGELVNDLSGQSSHDHHEVKTLPTDLPVVESTEVASAASVESVFSGKQMTSGGEAAARKEAIATPSSLSDDVFSHPDPNQRKSQFIEEPSDIELPTDSASMDVPDVAKSISPETDCQPTELPNFSNMSLDQIQQVLEQLEPDEMLTMTDGSTLDSPQPEHHNFSSEPVVDSPRPDFLRDLPIDIEALSPDVRDDIANVFQTVDAIAEEILASIGQRMNSGPPSSSPAPQPDQLHSPSESAQPSNASSIEDALQSQTDDPLGELERIAVDEMDDDDDALFRLPDDDLMILSDLESDAHSSTEPLNALTHLQLRLDHDAWTLGGDRQFVLTGTIQIFEPQTSQEHNDSGASTAEQISQALSLQIHLTDPQTGARLRDMSHPVTLSAHTLTPFQLSISEIAPTQASVILGEAFLYSSGADANRPVASQTFLVSMVFDGGQSHGEIERPPTEQPSDEQPVARSTDPSQLPLQSQDETSSPAHTPLPPLMPSTDERESSINHETSPSFQISFPSAPSSKGEDAEPSDEIRPANGDRPSLDLPDFVKSPTSLASSILGLAGLSSESFHTSLPNHPHPTPNEIPNDAQSGDMQSDLSHGHHEENAVPGAIHEEKSGTSDEVLESTQSEGSSSNLQRDLQDSGQDSFSAEDVQSDSPFDSSSGPFDEGLALSAPDVGPSEVANAAPGAKDDITDDDVTDQELSDHQERADQEASNSQNTQPYRETINHLEHVAQMTHDHFPDSRRIAYDDIDPFDLLDEHDDDVRVDTPYQGTANLAQQYIPDYSDDADPFNDFDGVDDEDDRPPLGNDALTEDWTPEKPAIERHTEPSPQPTLPVDPLTDNPDADADPWMESSDGEKNEGHDRAIAWSDEFLDASEPSVTQFDAPSALAADDVSGDHSSPESNDGGDSLNADSLEANSPRFEAASQQTEPLTPYSVLPEDVEVPTPIIECLDNEIIAGQSFYITITLPKLGPRIFVKLWIQDRHTRTLLDGPRWLADFVSLDDSNLMQAKTQLTIPLGAMEVRVEAIAMEMMTQRESHKVSIDKSVLPPDMPFFSLDDPLDDLL